VASASGSTSRVLVLVIIVILVSAASVAYVFLGGLGETGNDGNGAVPTSPILNINPAIHIDGDAALHSLVVNNSWTGDGTPENPYIIENQSIAEPSNCIDIRNVEASFIIQQCELATTLDNAGTAIYLMRCSNAVIRNCRTEGGISGIEFFLCNDVEVSDCIVSHTIFGINSSVSQRALIKGNTIVESWWGISIVASNETTVIDNEISGCETGLESQFSFSCLLNHCNITNNTLGVHLDVGCQNWTVYANSFSASANGNALDDGTNNLWDDNVSIGNIWDDYSGEGWYSIPGTAGSVDRFPQLP
jgi:parallel beta-helix repeat protein